MKNKKIIFSSIIILVLLIISFGVYYVFTKEDKETTLNLFEKQWIESNKNEVIDLGIVNDVPIFNIGGEGLFFDFLNSLEEVTALEFNKVSYSYGSEVESDYAFKIVDKPAANDILIYQDHYVLLTKNKTKYNSLDKISDLTIGVLNSNLENVNTYLKDAKNVTFKPYDNANEMIQEMNKVAIDGEDEEVSIDAIVLPKTLYLDQIISNDKLNIAYNITELNKSYVLSLGSVDKLNDILTKYYKKWSSENYKDSYNLHYANSYFAGKKIDEKAKVEFRSKRYVYGLVKNSPYDVINNGELIGINNTVLEKFSKLSDIEITYKTYSNVLDLIKAFNENKVDVFFNNTVTSNYDMDVYNTVSVFDEQVVIISDLSNNNVINSISSLKGEEVLTIRGSQIANYLNNNKVKITEFDSIDELLKNKDKNSFIAIDEVMYDYYDRSSLLDYKVDYRFVLPSDYTYTIRDVSDNAVFSQFFDFYLSTTITKDIVSESYNELLSIKNTSDIIKKIIIYLLPILGLTLFILWYLKKDNKKEKKSSNLTKGDKIRYIDLLTSLKNRNYLNDNIEKWDESEVYPQTIIVVDLNNIAYINDNYGHSEGDKVIKEAANILIKNQEENSDIIRTNGNEFLIYMVGYDEKKVVSYIRKLNKEFKELDHGFGAAIGYSIIVDAIKTIDDAINEATLDMRNNKEEINN